ncbi:MAG: hypothetical protein JXR50_02850 [Prolixibacteraceae bacterium]|nr:hypothetical protein [Prolixibacteraceae bacterium]
MEIQELTKQELMEIEGGDLKDTALKVFLYAYKYSSLTGAVLTGLAEGYYEEKAKHDNN